MNTKPILFNGDMVRALLDGRKTQTRRIAKPPMRDGISDITYCIPGEGCPKKWQGKFGVMFKEPESQWFDPTHDFIPSPFGQPGDLLWVRETHKCNGWATDVATIFYRACESRSYTEMCEQFSVSNHKPLPVDGRWRPSIFLPRWASRLTLLVKKVHIERAQDISPSDATAEGYQGDMPMVDGLSWFARLWNSINGNWDDNPWVWVVEFEVIHKNIDEVLKDKAA